MWSAEIEVVDGEEIDEEAVSYEVDMLFDYMDDRCDMGADPSDVATAIAIVMVMMNEARVDETVH